MQIYCLWVRGIPQRTLACHRWSSPPCNHSSSWWWPDPCQSNTPQMEKRQQIYTKEHFMKSKIQKQFRKDHRQLHQVHVSTFAWGRHCFSLCLCLLFFVCVAASHTNSGNNSNIYRKVWNACFTVHKCTNPNRLTTQTNNSYLSVKRKIWWPRCTIVQ